jgi:hypothetical protein
MDRRNRVGAITSSCTIVTQMYRNRAADHHRSVLARGLSVTFENRSPEILGCHGQYEAHSPSVFQVTSLTRAAVSDEPADRSWPMISPPTTRE